jgi:hypothetical protein
MSRREATEQDLERLALQLRRSDPKLSPEQAKVQAQDQLFRQMPNAYSEYEAEPVRPKRFAENGASAPQTHQGAAYDVLHDYAAQNRQPGESPEQAMARIVSQYPGIYALLERARLLDQAGLPLSAGVLGDGDEDEDEEENGGNVPPVVLQRVTALRPAANKGAESLRFAENRGAAQAARVSGKLARAFGEQGIDRPAERAEALVKLAFGSWR